MDPLIFDTSALLNFGQRGQLEPVLVRLARERKLFTTPTAAGELTDPKSRKFHEAFLRTHFTIQAAKTVPFDLQILARLTSVLDAGEISVMLLAKELPGIAVLDERPARREARNLNLKMIGTLGLLNEAILKGWLNDSVCIQKVAQMQAKGFSIPKPADNQTFAEYFTAIE